MKLLYPLVVTFFDERNEGTKVRVKGLTLDAFAADDFLPGQSCTINQRVFVADHTEEAPWALYFYVLVNCKGGETENLAMLHWFTLQALHSYRLSTQVKQKQQKNKEKGFDYKNSQQQQQQNQQQKQYQHHYQQQQQQHTQQTISYELALYDVNSSLTSIHDNTSILDFMFSTHHDEAAKKEDNSLTRSNNLYRLRVNSCREFRYLLQYFTHNSFYWQQFFQLPANLAVDHFRFALDIYVINLQAKVEHEKFLRDELIGSQLRQVLHHDFADLKPTQFQRIQHKRADEKKPLPDDLLRNDPLDVSRWFACGKWCLFDWINSSVSVISFSEFRKHNSSLGLALAQDLFDTPLQFLPRLVWDIETIAHGMGTIPRGITADQMLSSISLTIDRPAIDGKECCLLVLYVLVPPALQGREHEIVVGDFLTDYEKTQLGVGAIRVHPYTDEKAMLLDFLMDMFVNYSLLVDYFSIKPSECGNYSHAASLLVGHNTIDYDYSFLLDRCVFHGTQNFALCELALRRFSNLSRAICYSFTFNDAQICLDTMRHLQTRNRQLKSYKLSAVLKAYGCTVLKQTFSPVDIRRLYFSTSIEDPFSFLMTILRYNAYDCFSLRDLIDRMHFATHMTVMMDRSFSPLDVVVYKGNSSLLPSIVQRETCRQKREISVIRQPQHNRFFCGNNHLLRSNNKELQRRYQRQFLLESSPSAVDILSSENPFNAILHYFRAFTSGKTTISSPIRLDDLLNGRANLVAFNEMETLRVGEATYIGGMNHAEPGHAKTPILMDYNSFYPSIIRSYRLDVSKVAILSLGQLLLTIPIELLEYMLYTEILRLFDYTSLADLAMNVDTEQHARLHNRQKWHEAVEYKDLQAIIMTSRHAGRQFLALFYQPEISTIDDIVTRALERRAIWKRKKKENPNDVVVVFMEMMEKLLANTMYGYMNFSLSAIFSRATAAAVTLLCRNAFCRTRNIIESRELVATTMLDPDRYRFRVIYIDTDGCIFVPELIGCVADVAATPITTDTDLLIQLYADLPKNDTVASYNRLTDTINCMLNLKHVCLAAEHHDATAVCVFSRKKYVLLKAPSGSVKSTGFESNAASPIRYMFNRLLRNNMRAMHTNGMVSHRRFNITIRHHRSFLFAIFDKLHELWLDAANNTESEYTVQDFGTARPLNPKNDKGEMTQFIDRILANFHYTPGDRVWILKVMKPLTNVVENQTLYAHRDEFILFDEIQCEKYTTIVPNFKYFISNYIRYFYRCVEGQQTLKHGKGCTTREPIESCFYLSSYNAIVDYCWAAWLYCRVFKEKTRINGVCWSANESTVEPKKKKSKTTSDNNGGSELTDSILPRHLPESFFSDNKFPNKSTDNLFYVALFSEHAEESDRAWRLLLNDKTMLHCNLIQSNFQ